jgi:SAM-dependent methyltransferase
MLACPACEATRFSDRTVVPELRTHECSNCGLILGVIERSAPAVSEFALVDQEGYLRSVGATRRRQAADILRQLKRHVRPGARILDVGCSFGFFLEGARAAGFRVEGLEPDRQAYDHARRLLGDGVVRNTVLDRENTRPGSADAVSTLDVIEHIAVENHASFAERVRTVLVPDGVWVIKVPSTEGLYYKISDALVRAYPPIGASLVRRVWQTRYEYPHLVYFSLPSLSLWLRRYGFDTIGHRYLPEVPIGTIVDRLTTDGDIDRAKAYLAAPVVAGVTLIDALRGRSDALVVFARVRR